MEVLAHGGRPRARGVRERGRLALLRAGARDRGPRAGPPGRRAREHVACARRGAGGCGPLPARDRGASLGDTAVRGRAGDTGRDLRGSGAGLDAPRLFQHRAPRDDDRAPARLDARRARGATRREQPAGAARADPPPAGARTRRDHRRLARREGRRAALDRAVRLRAHTRRWTAATSSSANPSMPCTR